jgi:hypothetical protein
MWGFSLPHSSLKPPIRTLTLLKINLIVLSSTSVKEMLATILYAGPSVSSDCRVVASFRLFLLYSLDTIRK